MIGSGMNLVTTAIGFGISSAFIVFICTRLICLRRTRLRSRPMFEIGYRIDLEQGEHRAAGLEPVLVAAIPTMKFEREAFNSMEDSQCSICLGEYQEKEILRIMPKCGHNFHLSCIDVWLRKQPTCPVCRVQIQDSFETNERPLNNDAQELVNLETTINHLQQQLPAVPEHPAGNESSEGQSDSLSGQPEERQIPR